MRLILMRRIFLKIRNERELTFCRDAARVEPRCGLGVGVLAAEVINLGPRCGDACSSIMVESRCGDAAHTSLGKPRCGEG
jgi:hypothetical protein